MNQNKIRCHWIRRSLRAFWNSWWKKISIYCLLIKEEQSFEEQNFGKLAAKKQSECSPKKLILVTRHCHLLRQYIRSLASYGVLNRQAKLLSTRELTGTGNRICSKHCKWNYRLIARKKVDKYWEGLLLHKLFQMPMPPVYSEVALPDRAALSPTGQLLIWAVQHFGVGETY